MLLRLHVARTRRTRIVDWLVIPAMRILGQRKYCLRKLRRREEDEMGGCIANGDVYGVGGAGHQGSGDRDLHSEALALT